MNIVTRLVERVDLLINHILNAARESSAADSLAKAAVDWADSFAFLPESEDKRKAQTSAERAIGLAMKRAHDLEVKRQETRVKLKELTETAVGEAVKAGQAETMKIFNINFPLLVLRYDIFLFINWKLKEAKETETEAPWVCMAVLLNVLEHYPIDGGSWSSELLKEEYNRAVCFFNNSFDDAIVLDERFDRPLL